MADSYRRVAGHLNNVGEMHERDLPGTNALHSDNPFSWGKNRHHGDETSLSAMEDASRAIDRRARMSALGRRHRHSHRSEDGDVFGPTGHAEEKVMRDKVDDAAATAAIAGNARVSRSLEKMAEDGDMGAVSALAGLRELGGDQDRLSAAAAAGDGEALNDLERMAARGDVSAAATLDAISGGSIGQEIAATAGRSGGLGRSYGWSHSEGDAEGGGRGSGSSGRRHGRGRRGRGGSRGRGRGRGVYGYGGSGHGGSGHGHHHGHSHGHGHHHGHGHGHGHGRGVYGYGGSGHGGSGHGHHHGHDHGHGHRWSPGSAGYASDSGKEAYDSSIGYPPSSGFGGGGGSTNTHPVAPVSEALDFMTREAIAQQEELAALAGEETGAEKALGYKSLNAGNRPGKDAVGQTPRPDVEAAALAMGALPRQAREAGQSAALRSRDVAGQSPRPDVEAAALAMGASPRQAREAGQNAALYDPQIPVERAAANALSAVAAAEDAASKQMAALASDAVAADRDRAKWEAAEEGVRSAERAAAASLASDLDRMAASADPGLEKARQTAVQAAAERAEAEKRLAAASLADDLDRIAAEAAPTSAAAAARGLAGAAQAAEAAAAELEKAKLDAVLAAPAAAAAKKLAGAAQAADAAAAEFEKAKMDATEPGLSPAERAAAAGRLAGAAQAADEAAAEFEKAKVDAAEAGLSPAEMAAAASSPAGAAAAAEAGEAAARMDAAAAKQARAREMAAAAEAGAAEAEMEKAAAAGDLAAAGAGAAAAQKLAEDAEKEAAGQEEAEREEASIEKARALNEMGNAYKEAAYAEAAGSGAHELARTLGKAAKEEAMLHGDDAEASLGILGTIPDDAKSVEVHDGYMALPLKTFSNEKPKNEGELAAKKRQNRLADSLRNTVTEDTVQSPLNTVKGSDGTVFNIPESAQKLKIDDGTVYYPESAKAEMEKEGVDTSALKHRYNLGERKDKQIGEGYYAADASGKEMDLPSPTLKSPSKVLTGRYGLLDIGKAEGLEIAKGRIDMIPWNKYNKYMHSEVNFPSKLPVIPAAVEKALRNAEKDAEALAMTKREVITNPSGKQYVRITPPIGVPEQVDMEEVMKSEESGGAAAEKGSGSGQDRAGYFGAEESSSAEKRARSLNIEEHASSASQNTTEDAYGSRELSNAQMESETKDIPSRSNSFNKQANASKESMLNKTAGSSSEDRPRRDYKDPACPVKALGEVMDENSPAFSFAMRMPEEEFISSYTNIPERSVRVFLRYEREHKDPEYQQQYIRAYGDLKTIYGQKAEMMLKILSGATKAAKDKCMPIRVVSRKVSKVPVRRKVLVYPKASSLHGPVKVVQRKKIVLLKPNVVEKNVLTPVTNVTVQKG